MEYFDKFKKGFNETIFDVLLSDLRLLINQFKPCLAVYIDVLSLFCMMLKEKEIKKTIYIMNCLCFNLYLRVINSIAKN